MSQLNSNDGIAHTEQLDDVASKSVNHVENPVVSELLVSANIECYLGTGDEATLDGIAQVDVSFSIRTLSRQQVLILCCLATTELTAQMCLSVMAPFFPSEASLKDVSNTVSGWIFGVFALVQFAVSPMFGQLIPHIGSRLLIITGQFLAGGCTILFGFLDRIGTPDDNAVFVAYCFILRVVLAVGCTASTTSGFAITAKVFPQHIATVFGLLETATGLGMMLGPAVGGVLYEFGGFVLPFVVLGSLMLVSVPLFMVWLPQTDGVQVGTVRPVSVAEIMRIPAIIVVCCAVVTAALVWSILDPTLAPHFEATDIDISSSILGLLFLVLSAFYAVFSPIWGWLTDRMTNCSPMLASGFVLSGIGLLLLGPSPWVSFIGYVESDEPLWLNVIALVVLGISISLSLVPTFDKILDAVEKAGIEESFAMYSIVAGIWSSCYALGDFMGPALGGWLLDRPGGFPWCVTYVACACFLMALTVFLLWIFEARQSIVQPTCSLCCSKLKIFLPCVTVNSDIIAGSNERTPLLIHTPSTTSLLT